ncbi:MAG: hypothetical protein K5840_08765 [Eubacterium sp.]|nr:hypothetical protein [Eubacterium sp.]
MMKILVCIKQVPAEEKAVPYSEALNGPDFSGIDNKINVYDRVALETALREKDAGKDVVIHVLTVGGPETTESLRRAYACGADEVYRASVQEPFADGTSLAAYISGLVRELEKDNPYDMVLIGSSTTDEGSGTTAGQAAIFLDRPYVSQVNTFEVEDDGVLYTSVRSGKRIVTSSQEPCVASFAKVSIELRYASIPALSRAVDHEIPEIGGGVSREPELLSRKEFVPRPPRKPAFMIRELHHDDIAVEKAMTAMENDKVFSEVFS